VAGTKSLEVSSLALAASTRALCCGSRSVTASLIGVLSGMVENRHVQPRHPLRSPPPQQDLHYDIARRIGDHLMEDERSWVNGKVRKSTAVSRTTSDGIHNGEEQAAC